MKSFSTRMHSSRMRTTHSSSCLLGSVCLSACWDTSPGVGLETPPPSVGLETPPWVWAWKPPGCEPGDTPPQVWPWRPPQARSLNFPPGCGPGDLQGILGYHHPWRPARHAGIPPAMHAGIPPPLCEQNSWHMLLKILPCPNFFAGGKYCFFRTRL